MNRDQYFLMLEIVGRYISTAIHETEVYYLTEIADKPVPDKPDSTELSWMCLNRLKRTGLIEYDEKFLNEIPEDGK